MSSTANFGAVRRQFPHTRQLVYFNSASYGPMSRPVTSAIEDNLRLREAADKDDTAAAFAAAGYLRKTFARLIGARWQDVGLGLNTSFGLNLAAFGLPLKRGDEILIPDTEFPAIVYTWRAAAETRDLKIKLVPTKERCFDLDHLKAALTRKSRVVCLSWVQFFNGYRVDLREVAEFCKKHHLYLVVDGIQGMGVEPINVRKLGIDIFTSGCQKWMLSPHGCGFFYLSEKIRAQLSLPFMSWLGVDWQLNFTDLFKYDLPWADDARKFEMGYYVTTNLFGMAAAAKMFVDLGISNIRRHNYALQDTLATYIKNSEIYRITSDLRPRHRSSILTFTCDGLKELHRRILKSKIVLSEREGSIRVSTHLFNNQTDVAKLIRVLQRHERAIVG